ncbi:AEC family transporter [Cohnella luojiensis]|uniref:AEC family transporter n=1 Tax=Cohnella luojiensis TaxID=652876 RepID=A0A4Y8LSX8_9BACL|nr:AEC family transporter [Cohnella luojiensis]TFE23966.1 AEC family transporter [Cohnella luojiensis]
MDVLFLILLQVIFPVFAMLAAGAVLHRKYRFDMKTLSRLTTSVFMPALAFVNIYESQIAGDLLADLILFLLVQNLGLMVVGNIAARVAGLDRKVASTFKNSVVLNNSGNYGLPVSQLVFAGNPAGMSIQVIVTIFQNLVTHTYGLFNSISVQAKGVKTFVEMVKMPILYALLAGVALKGLGVAIPGFIWKPVENVANAFLAVALFTLGAQVAYLKIRRPSLLLTLTVIGRLLVSPSLALLIITIMGLEGVTAQALFIASSYPCSRNTALFALEYDNDPDYAAEAVLLTTLLSAITVTVVVYLSKIFW